MRAAIRRLAILIGSAAAATLILSIAIGLSAGSRLSRSISVGFYSVGALFLLGCFIFGARGPFRPVWHDEERRGFMTPRGLRRAGEDERSESLRTSLLLFTIGMGFIVIAAALDPDHKLS